MRSPRRLLMIVLLPVVTACQFDSQTIPGTSTQIVVHGVLNPGVLQQQVIVEKLLTGVVTVRNRRYDPFDPVNTGGGIPVRGATVTISGPDGTLRLTELATSTTYGAGLYLGQTGTATQPLIRPGARYVLRVVTPEGIVITGTTYVPNATPAPPPTAFTAFDRSRDTLRYPLRPIAGARSFGLRVDSPFSAFTLFADTGRFVLQGELRNLFSSSLDRVLQPGFRQTATLFAADTNFYNYYRTRNDPFTGSGIISSVHGGIGVFGSVVDLDLKVLEVTEPFEDPAFEGIYDLVVSPSPGRAIGDVISLYIETKAATSALSGYYIARRSIGTRDGLIGTRSATNRIVLRYLRNQDATDTTAGFTGTFSGDSIYGTFLGFSGRAVYRKRP